MGEGKNEEIHSNERIDTTHSLTYLTARTTYPLTR